jgi:hypothetical protein
MLQYRSAGQNSMILHRHRLFLAPLVVVGLAMIRQIQTCPLPTPLVVYADDLGIHDDISWIRNHILN